MRSVVQDLRFAVRRLRHAPTYTVVAVVTLALGIGTTTAMFSIAYGVLLKPLPYREPSRLVQLASVRDGQPYPMSGLDFIDYRRRAHGFAGITAMDIGTMNLTRAGAEPQRLHVGLVSPSFFEVLGVAPVLGRTFAANEEQPSGSKVVVVSYAVWQSLFGGDRHTIGRTMSLDGVPYTVIGVAPRWMHYPQQSEIWVTLFRSWEIDPMNRGAHDLMGIARLAPGVTMEQGARELAGIGAQLAAEYPESNARTSAGIWPLRQQMVQDARQALVSLLAAVGFVLLVVCANVANLQLAQAAGREAEMALRSALGAARWQIVRQLLAESTVLALGGAVLGILLARWLVDAVVAFGPVGLPRLDEVALDGRVLLFAAALTVATGLVFGLAPALQTARGDVAAALRTGARGAGTSTRARRLRHGLVVVEAALAVVLLVGAGLFLRSFAHLVGIDPGFKPVGVSTATISLPGERYRHDGQIGAFAERLLAALTAQPGMADAAISYGRPLGADHISTSFEVTGWPPTTPATRRTTYVRPVSAGFFGVLGIPIVAGRGFTAADRADAPQVMVVSREFVRRYFPDASPLGKVVTLGWSRDSADWGAHTSAGGEIVGIVPDVTERGPGSTALPFVYVPFAQAPVRDLSILVRTPLPLAAAGVQTRAVVHGLDPDLPLFDETTMPALLSASVAQPRFYLVLLSGFGALGLLLAALGIYGVISYGVSARVREIGIRIALGATQRRVMGLTIRQGVTLALIGVPIGLAAAFGLSRYIATLLFDTPTADWQTFAAVSATLVGAAVLASYLPARRAAAIDPAIAMRAE